MKTRKSAAIILSVLFFFTAAPSQPVFAGNAEETPGCQLQTILIDNGGNQIADRIGSVRGDLNTDGKCGIADAVLLQKYLLTIETKLPNWKAGDPDENGTLNAADLTLMKQLLMK